MSSIFANAPAGTAHDQRAIDLLRLDVIHYQRLTRDFYLAVIDAQRRAAVLERQLAETREELRRVTSEVCR